MKKLLCVVIVVGLHCISPILSYADEPGFNIEDIASAKISWEETVGWRKIPNGSSAIKEPRERNIAGDQFNELLDLFRNGTYSAGTHMFKGDNATIHLNLKNGEILRYSTGMRCTALFGEAGMWTIGTMEDESYGEACSFFFTLKGIDINRSQKSG